MIFSLTEEREEKSTYFISFFLHFCSFFFPSLTLFFSLFSNSLYYFYILLKTFNKIKEGGEKKRKEEYALTLHVKYSNSILWVRKEKNSGIIFFQRWLSGLGC